MRSVVLILVTALCGWAQTRPVTVEDTLSLWSLGEIAASPKGPALLYSVSRVNLKENRSSREWRQLGVDGTVKGLAEGASGLRWSPDGKRLAYLSASALWVLDWETKKETRVCAV